MLVQYVEDNVDERVELDGNWGNARAGGFVEARVLC